MTTTAPGLRERKKQRTYDDLQRAALDLFAAHGFDHVTIDDICAAAEVSKSTFYRYFETKEDVLLGTAGEKFELMRSALAERPDGEAAIVGVRNAFLEVAEHYQINRTQKFAVGCIVRTTPSLAARNLEQQAAWEDLLRDYFCAHDGAKDAELGHCVLAATVVASLRAAVDYWLTRGANADLPAIVDEALQVSLAAPRRSRSR